MTNGGFTGFSRRNDFTLPDRLFLGLEAFGDAIAVIDQSGAPTSYRALARRADDRAKGLGDPGQLVLIEAANAIEPLELYVGALRAGHAVILTDDNPASVERLLSRFQPSAHYRREGLDWTLTRRKAPRAELHPDLAVMLSTSGSTGSPKLVRLSHANLFSNARSITEYLEFSPGERAITSLPLYYSYGLSIVHSHLLFGHSLVLSTLSAADDDFWLQVEQQGVTSFAGVPHSYELLAARGFLDRPHPGLRYLTQAGGRLSPERVKAFAAHAENAGSRFYVMYGQTEAAPRMAFVPPGEVSNHPDVIGIPIPGGAFRIEATEGGFGYADGAGELIYSGPNVMMGYASAAADLRLGQGPSELKTGDIARKGDDGYYRIVGRRSRFAKLFGLRIAFDELEDRFRAVGLPAVVTGNDDGILVTTTLTGATARITETFVRSTGLPSGMITVTEVSALPRLSSGKLDYAAMAAARAKPNAGAYKSLREAFTGILGGGVMFEDDSFISRGGDSLSYVQASLLIEQHFGRAPAGWERMRMIDLEERAAQATNPPRSGVQSLEPSVFVRALAIILVLFHHASQLPMGGAADALLLTAGLNFGRFQAPRVVHGGLFSSLLSTFCKVLMPYFIMLSLLFGYVGQVFWPQYLLVSNFTDGFFVDGVRRLQIYWFMETYLLLFVGCSLALATGPVRRLAQRFPWRTAFVAVLIAAGLRAWSALDHQNFLVQSHTPFALAWLFTLGWLISVSDTVARRWVAGLLALSGIILAPASLREVDLGSMMVLAVLTSLLIGGFHVPVGRGLSRLGALVASASLYIYIAQPVVLQPFGRLPRLSEQPLIWLLQVVLCIAVGVVLWTAVRFIERWIARWRSAARPNVEPVERRLVLNPVGGTK